MTSILRLPDPSESAFLHSLISFEPSALPHQRNKRPPACSCVALKEVTGLQRLAFRYDQTILNRSGKCFNESRPLKLIGRNSEATVTEEKN